MKAMLFSGIVLPKGQRLNSDDAGVPRRYNAPQRIYVRIVRRLLCKFLLRIQYIQEREKVCPLVGPIAMQQPLGQPEVSRDRNPSGELSGVWYSEDGRSREVSLSSRSWFGLEGPR